MHVSSYAGSIQHYTYDITLARFYLHLAREKKNKRLEAVADAFGLARGEITTRSTKTGVVPPAPSFPMWKQVFDSYGMDTYWQLKRKTVHALLLGFGLRIDALRTLKLGSLDINTMVVTQNPDKGVGTKMGIFIKTPLFRFIPELETTIRLWYHVLVDVFGLGKNAPFIPKNEIDYRIGAPAPPVAPGTIERNHSESQTEKIVACRFEQVCGMRFSHHATRKLTARLAENVLFTMVQQRAFRICFGHKVENDIVINLNYRESDRDWAVRMLADVEWHRALEGGYPSDSEIEKMIFERDVLGLAQWVRKVRASLDSNAKYYHTWPYPPAYLLEEPGNDYEE